MVSAKVHPYMERTPMLTVTYPNTAYAVWQSQHKQLLKRVQKEFTWEDQISGNITTAYFEKNPVLLLAGNTGSTKLNSKYIITNKKKQMEK